MIEYPIEYQQLKNTFFRYFEKARYLFEVTLESSGAKPVKQ